MRTASSYRGAKKKAAREASVSFAKFNEHYERSRHYAAAELERAEARKKLAQWASNPQINDAELTAMNNAPLDEAATAKKISIEEIDKALENTLTKWQADGRPDPLPLSRLFAARARQLGWIEGVEFKEDEQ